MSDQAAYDVESILLRLKELVEAGRSMPMSASVLVNRINTSNLLAEPASQNGFELLDPTVFTTPWNVFPGSASS